MKNLNLVYALQNYIYEIYSSKYNAFKVKMKSFQTLTF